MKSLFRHLPLIVLLLQCTLGFSQDRVGVVLSGGGATGLAHIGVLKALEENNIPIDFISGTSAGALVGSMYSAGFSPEQIEQYVLSKAFQKMSSGEIEPNQRFAYRELDTDASLFSIDFTADSILQKSLPTNFTSSSYLDFEMMKMLGTTGASYQNNYDSLFVPFRCVASDITRKKSVVFRSGSLNESVRASMTYPFYFTPIKVNGVLLFDGGLYNNFPADILYQEFAPDFIIGSNVSYNAAAPQEDDLISQITNMLVSYSDFNLPCEQGILIEPKTDVSTFDFDNVKKAIEDGYNSAQPYIDSILTQVKRRVTKEELELKRKEFRSRVIELNISSISNNFSKKKALTFVRKSMLRTKKQEVINVKTLERRYFRLLAAQQVDFIFPKLELKEDSTYNLNLNVHKSKDFKFDFGGHFSSRPVNTGFIGLTYRMLNKTASSIYANSYFGKFYGSVKAEYSIEFPSIFPVSFSTYFVMNRWDYFRSFATFFEDVRPSFLVQNEMYYGLQFKHPIGNTTKSTFDGRFFQLEDDYYQIENFTNKDTSDVTSFQGVSFSWEFKQNTLNRKQFASSGHYASFKARYVYGKEHTIPGSTSPNGIDAIKYHNWLNFNAEFKTFIVDHPFFHFGIHGNATFNSQSLFTNYTSSILAMTEYSPIPDMNTYFLPEFRSPQFVAAGVNLIFSINKRIDYRIDGYYYQPFVKITKNDDGTFGYSKPFKGESIVASTSFIYHSFIGPIRATVNYMPTQVTPITFQLSFGYVLFNDRAIR